MTDLAPHPRQPGLRGRLPQLPEGRRLNLKWAHQYLKEPLAEPAYPINVAEGISDFGMLGNDSAGDCGEAGIRHLELTTAAAAGQTVPTFTAAEALQEYFAYTGGADTGVVLADFLLWLYQQGRIVAFAPVDHTDRASCDAFMAAGYGLYEGVSLTPDAEQLFQYGRPWTVSDGQHPDPNLGHCIVQVGATAQDGTDLHVTWGALQPSTAEWTAACRDEAWLIVTTEEQLAAFTDDLLGDVQALGGTGGSQPAPTPQPANPPPAPEPAPPPPTPGPDPNVIAEDELNVAGDEEQLAEDIAQLEQDEQGATQ